MVSYLMYVAAGRRCTTDSACPPERSAASPAGEACARHILTVREQSLCMDRVGAEEKNYCPFQKFFTQFKQLLKKHIYLCNNGQKFL